jgi:sialic acid synthase SpsE
VISSDVPPYIVAEIGSNHNQDLELAKELIRVAASCGADAVKFQSLNLEKQYAVSAQTPQLRELFRQIRLDESWYPMLAEEAKKNGVDFFSAPTYLESIPLLEAVDVPFYKLASPQIRTFPALIKKVAALGKPIIMSVGYCNYGQIEKAVNLCLSEGNDQLILLHCVSEYHTLYHKVNLNNMKTLSSMFDCLVGLSDHTLGYEVPAASVALGAAVIEKHFTLDRSYEGPDHFFALEPEEFKAMAAAVKNVHAALGTGRKLVTEHEAKFANTILVRWHANRDIARGEVITENDVCWLRADSGISDENFHLLGQLRATRDIRKDAPVRWGDVELIHEGESNA